MPSAVLLFAGDIRQQKGDCSCHGGIFGFVSGFVPVLHNNSFAAVDFSAPDLRGFRQLGKLQGGYFLHL